jgi:hypothetical protein
MCEVNWWMNFPMMRKKISFKNTNFALLILLMGLFLVPDLVSAQPYSSTANRSKITALLPIYLKKHAHERPPKSTQERLKKFEEYIDYFTSLSYTRPGFKVDANFIRALVSAESAADPYAVSNKNAIGLSQITIATGKIAAKELYKTKYDFDHVDEERLINLQESDLYDPAINLLICTYLIDKYIRNYKGNLALIISAWNAGPGAVRQYRGYPPYNETLTLIARVNAYFKHYQKFYI